MPRYSNRGASKIVVAGRMVLSDKVLELAPNGCSNIDKIPFMTAGGDLGQKSLIDVKANDNIQGIILQDFKSDDTGPGISLR